MSTEGRSPGSSKHRKLRIAWSVTWGVVAVLLCVLWVRSYQATDIVIGQSFSTTTNIIINRGSITLQNTVLDNNSPFVWRVQSLPPQRVPAGGFRWKSFPSLRAVQ